MADGTPAFDIPPGAKSVVTSTTITGAAASITLYTALASQRLVILSAWVSATTSALAGQAEVRTTPEFDASVRTLVGVTVPATADVTLSNAVSCVVPTIGNVSLTTTTFSGTTVGGISGYTEATEK